MQVGPFPLSFLDDYKLKRVLKAKKDDSEVRSSLKANPAAWLDHKKNRSHKMVVGGPAHAEDMPWIAVSKDKKEFVLEPSGKRFIPWGFNYDHDSDGRLIEDYWDEEWPTVEAHFGQMKKLGANVVRIHLQLGKFMEAPDKANEKALGQLDKLLRLAGRERHRGPDETHPARKAGRISRNCLDASSDHKLRRHGDSQSERQTAGGPAHVGPALPGVAGPLSSWRAGARRMPAQDGVSWSRRRSRELGESMKIATYNILKGGSQRVQWLRMIEDFKVDLLLVQESYPHDEHLPPLTYPDAGKRSAWELAGRNGWGSAVYSCTGAVKPVSIPHFAGWVVGAEISRASWQSGIADPLLAFSVHTPSRGEAYWKQVNKLLDEIMKVARGREVVIGGDFNLTVSHWPGPERPTCKQDLASQARLAKEFGLLNCWQDATELTGDINYTKLAHYGVDSDPRAFGFDGEFEIANRGFVEFIEVLKLEKELLYDLLGVCQERQFKPKKFPQIDVDSLAP